MNKNLKRDIKLPHSIKIHIAEFLNSTEEKVKHFGDHLELFADEEPASLLKYAIMYRSNILLQYIIDSNLSQYHYLKGFEYSIRYSRNKQLVNFFKNHVEDVESIKIKGFLGAIRAGKLELAKYFRKNISDEELSNQPTLCHAAKGGNVKLFKFCFKKLINSHDLHPQTKFRGAARALCCAIIYNHIDIIKYVRPYVIKNKFFSEFLSERESIIRSSARSKNYDMLAICFTTYGNGSDLPQLYFEAIVGAARGGHLDLIIDFMKKLNKIGIDDLYHSYGGREETVHDELLWGAGKNDQYNVIQYFSGHDSSYALIGASEKGHYPMIKNIIKSVDEISFDPDLIAQANEKGFRKISKCLQNVMNSDKYLADDDEDEGEDYFQNQEE